MNKIEKMQNFFSKKEMLDINKIEDVNERTATFLTLLKNGLGSGDYQIITQAKCVCVDARQATPEEIGEKFTVYSHGKVEKEFIIQEDTVFLTTLDKNGKPIIDEQGHTNTYDMPLAQFNKKYHLHENGHYVQDPTPIATIKIPEDSIPEQGITVVPPFWGGYEGTLMRGGLIMMPLNTELSNEID